VDYSALVGEIEALADLDQDRDYGVLVGHDVGFEEFIEVVASEKLLHDIRDFVFDAVIKDEGDIAVDEIADKLGFLLKALPHFVVRSGAHLDRHFPFDKGVPALVNDAKAADGDLLDHLILSNCRRLIHVAYFNGNDLRTPQERVLRLLGRNSSC
jgi:hypothetical protein